MKVLLIEDNPRIRGYIKKELESHTFVVDCAENGENGARLALLHSYDIVVLDFCLPRINGLQVAQRIRKCKKSLPIIVTSIKEDLDMKIKMLSICDDYIIKPFSLRELVARLRAIKRRGSFIQSNTLEVGDLRLDLQSCKVTRSGKRIKLRNKEMALLEYLMRYPNTVISRAVLLENVWDMNIDPFSNTVDVHIRHLRKKIDDGYKNKLIKTIPRRGYKISSR